MRWGELKMRLLMLRLVLRVSVLGVALWFGTVMAASAAGLPECAKDFKDEAVFNADILDEMVQQARAEGEQLRQKMIEEAKAESQKVLNELSAAKLCLLDPKDKAAYDEAASKLAGLFYCAHDGYKTIGIEPLDQGDDQSFHTADIQFTSDKQDFYL